MMSKTNGLQALITKLLFVCKRSLFLCSLPMMVSFKAYCSPLVDVTPQTAASTVLAYHQTTSSQSAPASAPATQATNAYECTQVAIEDIDPNLLTKEERIALLDGTLQESIDQYSTCVSTVQQSMSGGGGAGGGGDEGVTEGAEGPEGLDAEGEQAETDTTNNGAPPSNSEVTESTPPTKKITPAQRGVIPPKDNDKIICKLLFNEIQSINDPDMLKGLKEQYESYKCG